MNTCLNESPRPEAGKYALEPATFYALIHASMKVPARRRGNELYALRQQAACIASMKVTTRRWGNGWLRVSIGRRWRGLDESPHPKAGKSPMHQGVTMKVLQPQ